MAESTCETNDDAAVWSDPGGAFILLLDFFLARRCKRDIGEQLRNHIRDEEQIIARQLCKRIEWARRRKDTEVALTLFEVMVALGLTKSLSAKNFLWLAKKADRAATRGTMSHDTVERGLTQWLYGNGPVDRDIVALAESKQRETRSISLDRLVLWIEPTPSRWRDYALGLWSSYQREHGVQGFDRERDVAFVDRFAVYERNPKRILDERGDPARRALRAAAHEPGEVQPILNEWLRRDGSDSWHAG